MGACEQTDKELCMRSESPEHRNVLAMELGNTTPHVHDTFVFTIWISLSQILFNGFFIV